MKRHTSLDTIELLIAMIIFSSVFIQILHNN